MLPSRHDFPRRSRVALIAILWLAAGCRDRAPAPYAELAPPAPAVPHAKVERDLRDLRADGALRVLFRYDSSNYFLHKGGQAGFEYELIELFARERGLSVAAVVTEPGADIVSLLNEGVGDIACGSLIAEPEHEQWVAVTRPTNFARKVLVLPADDVRADAPAALGGLTVTLPAHDPFRRELQKMSDAGGWGLGFGVSPARLDAEDLVAEVARGRLDAAVVDDLVAQAALTYRDDVRVSLALGERRPTVWFVRQNSPELRAALNAFLRSHLNVDADGRERRSDLYATLHERYFEDPRSIRRFRDAELRPDLGGAISQYDDLIRARAAAFGMDWHVVAALIYQESRFEPEALSIAGAMGLMQVLPSVAGAQADSLHDPRANLTAGVRLLRTIYDGYAYCDSLDRWCFTLAEYHAGPTRITDARRIAMEQRRDPNRWEGSVSVTLPKLADSVWAGKIVSAPYAGGRTVRYVNQVLNRARLYAQVVPLDGAAPDSGSAQPTLATALTRPTDFP
ncbi:MAG: transglycosylase SLT domain-containing protein [bacterium]|nr:transglycosylase SLT domain-containing protein [bacterium]